MDKTSIAITALVAVIVLSVGWVVMGEAADRYEAQQNQYQQWCDSQNGELEQGFAGGDYSGFECTLPSGKTVDMAHVAENDYPKETHQLQDIEEWTPDYTPFVVDWRIFLAALSIAATVGVVSVIASRYES